VNENSIQTETRHVAPPFSARKAGTVATVAALGILIAVVAWYWFAEQSRQTAAVADAPPTMPTISSGSEVQASEESDNATRSVSEEVAPAPVAAPITTTAAPAQTLPVLQASDGFVRENFEQWSVPTGLMGRVLDEGDLLARLSVVVANFADGILPTRLLKPYALVEKFTVEESGDRLYLDSASYDRYQSYVDVVENIPPAKAAAFMRLVDPLLVEALAQLGERRSPRLLLQDAAERLFGLPTLPSEIELVKKEAIYQYANEDLETLPEFDKQLLRFGSNNVQRLKTWGIEFAREYGLDLTGIEQQ
jgi:hypothetical protein